MKQYIGYRLQRIRNAGKVYFLNSVRVFEPGKEPRPLDPRRKSWKVDDKDLGFEWGSVFAPGHLILALALSVDLLGDERRAMTVYKPLMSRVIANLPADGWTIDGAALLEIVAQFEDELCSGDGRGMNS